MNEYLVDIAVIALIAVAIWIIRMSLKRLSPDEPAKNEPPTEPQSKDLERVLQERLLEEQMPKPRCVVFVDMLGFSQLTEDHPNDIDWKFDSEEITHIRD